MQFLAFAPQLKLSPLFWTIRICSLTLLLFALISSCPAQTAPPASFVTSHLVASGPVQNATPVLAIGDMNNDGIPDLVTAGSSNNNGGVSVLLGKGDGTFPNLTYFAPAAGYTTLAALALGDFNHDGNLDVALLIRNQPGSVYIYLGDGAGNLGSPSAPIAVGNSGSTHYNNIAVADLNGDGNLDLVVTNDYDNTVSVLLGNGDGTFQPQVTYFMGSQAGANWVAVGDVNNDGKPDLVVAANGNTGVAVICVLLNNGNGTFQTPLSYPGPYQANGVAIADLNGDGKLDVVAASDAPWDGAMVFLGNGDGTFQAPVSYYAPYASSIAIADLNGDNKPDLVLADMYDSTVWVLLGNGNGTFKPGVAYATDWGDQGLALADLNKDGKIDFVVGNNEGTFVTVGLGNGDGTFRDGTNYNFTEAYQVYNIVAADVNNDGNLDLVESDPTNHEVLVSLGSSHGVMATPSTIAICDQNTWVDVGDVNGDGKLDIVTVAEGGGCSNNSYAGVLLGKGNGTFEAPVYYVNTDGSQPSFVKLADINGDNKLDILISNSDGSVTIFLNKGHGTFGTARVISGVTAGGEYIETGDFNGDGKVDLVLPDYGNNTIKLLLGNGNGTFQSPISVPGSPAGPSGLVVGDFNQDGKLDLAITSNTIGLGGSYGGGGVQILLGNGDGTFTTGGIFGWTIGSLGLGAPGTSPGELTSADVNGDGILDLLIPLSQTHIWNGCNCGIESGNDGLAVLLGNGDGTFTNDPSGPFIAGRGSAGVVTGDFNNDGAIDAAVLENTGGSGATYVSMLINSTPPVSISPLSIKFPARKVGTSSSVQTVVLTNNQATTLTLHSIKLGGSDPGDFGEKTACKASVLTGADCTISVTFKPTSTGSRTATLTITDSLGTQSVTLSGTGQ